MRIKTMIGLSVALLLLASCSSNSDTEGTEVTPTPSLSSENPPEKTETPEVEDVPEMVTRSLLMEGNNARIKKVMERAKQGEEITMAFLGGSITEGYNAKTEEIYAKRTYEYFADTYSSRDKVHYVNAGLSGTPSMLGLIRADRDILTYEPDIIFIEFAVNDGGSLLDKQAYESLVRKCLTMENEPAVILLFSYLESGYTCQDQMQVIGFNYKLPGISVKNAIAPEIQANTMEWSDWADDEAHPNANGQKLYSEFIIHYLKQVDKAETDEPAQLPERMVNGSDLSGMKLFDNTNLEVTTPGDFKEGSAHPKFPQSWIKEGTETSNEPLTFTFEGKALFMVFKEVSGDAFGTAEIYIDGEKATVAKGGTPSGWNNPATTLIFREKESKTHKVEIKMAEGEEAKGFAILAFGICE